MIKEESVMIDTESCFYNPKVRIHRSLSSLAIGAIREDVSLLDAFSGCGVRGLRYKKENKNLRSLIFLDYSKRAINRIKENLRLNSVKATTINRDFSSYLISTKRRIDVIEIDPFGSPAYYFYPLVYYSSKRRITYASITATDMMVLCGPHSSAAEKIYRAKTLNMDFTHEVGMRILLKRLADEALLFGLGLEPLFSFSYLHHKKVFVRLSKGKGKADRVLDSIGFLNFNKTTGERWVSKAPENKIFAGPLWISDIHNVEFLKEMKKLNEERDYGDKKAISSFLNRMSEEVGMPPYYYDVHKLAKILRIKKIKPINEIIDSLRGFGFKAGRTHFLDRGLKTDAPLEKIKEVMKE